MIGKWILGDRWQRLLELRILQREGGACPGRWKMVSVPFLPHSLPFMPPSVWFPCFGLMTFDYGKNDG